MCDVRLSTQGKPLRVCPQEADLRSRLGTHRTCQHRLGDIDAQGEPVRDRTRVDSLQGATTWTGQGVCTHNLTKIAALTA
jgi:hypothetical protein